MDDMFRQLLPCFGILFGFVPLVLCVILWMKLQTLRDRVQVLETRLADTARQWWNWANGMTAHVKTLAPAGASADTPLHPADRAPVPGAGVSPLAEAPAQPRPASPAPATTPFSPPAAPRTTEHLRDRVDELRHKPTTPFAPTPAPPHPAHQPPAPPATPPAAHPTPTPAILTPTPAKPPAAAPSVVTAGTQQAHTATPPVHGAIPPPAKHPPVATAAPGAHPPAPAQRKPGLEAYLGMKLFVVVGAIALALAAIFLVKIGIEQGYFGPLVRDSAMLLAGIGLIAVSQWRRRHEGFWSQGLAAAGIIVLFATFFAATMLHNFLAVPQGFVALALTTALAVGLALQDWSGGRAGPKGGFLIATLGLVGGFLTPVLIHSNTPNVPGLFGYLLLLHLGIVAATRLRGWSILAALAMLFSSAWLILWMVFGAHAFNPADGPIYGSFLLASAFAVILSTAGEPHRWSGGPVGLAARVLTWLAAGLSLVAACILLGKSNFLDLEWAFFAALVAGSFVLGRLRRMYEGMTWLSCTAVVAMLFVWAGVDHAHLAPADLPRLIGWVAGLGIGCTLAAYGCQWKSAVPLRWTMLTVALGLVYVALAYAVIPQPPRPDAWGWLPLAAAVLFAILSLPLFHARATMATAEASLALYLTAILAFLFAAAPMANFHGGTLTALWAALLPLAALAVWRLRVPGLLLGFLAVAFVLAARGLTLQSFLHLHPDGYSLFWNPIVWTYGSIVLAFALSAWLVERLPAHPDRLLGVIPSPSAISALLQTGAITAGFLLLTFLVRWYFHHGKMDDASFLLEERGTFAVTWLLVAAALVWMGAATKRVAMTICGQVAGAIAMIYVAVVLMLAGNPLLTGENVGTTRVFNDLLYVFGVPALLCAALAWVNARGAYANEAYAKAAGVLGLALTFVLVTLEVRQGYAGGVLNAGSVSFIEWGTYAIAWLLLSLLAHVVGKALSWELVHSAGLVYGTIAMAYAGIVLGSANNPLLTGENVGPGLIFNELLYVYGLPAALCGVLAYVHALNKRGSPAFTRAAGIVALLLAFVLVSLEVRHGYVRGPMNEGGVTFLEWGTYSVAWMMMGIIALIVGMAASGELLRRAGVLFGAGGLLYAIAIVGLIMNPVFHHQSVGTWPVLNHLLFSYGTPLLLALLLVWLIHPGPRGAAKFFRHRGDDDGGLFSPWQFDRALRHGIALLTFILFTTEVRQFFQGEFLDGETMFFVERATYPIIWLALSGISLILAHRFLETIARRTGLVLAWLGLTVAVVICAVLFNPLIWHESVGTMKVFNWLLYAYGLPAVAAALLARVYFKSSAEDTRALAWLGGLSGLVLVFILVTLEVQHFFRGDHLAFGNGPTGEMATYSLAWAALGAIWLVTGILTKSTLFRWASLVMMLLTIFKVFLFDLTGLSDIQRVLSLAGLGVSLMALAFIYNRFVFRKEPPVAPQEA